MSIPKIDRSLNLGAVRNRKPRSDGLRTISVIRGPNRQRYRLKPLAAVALALAVIVAAIACFATSPSMPKTAKSFSNPWTIYTIDSNGGWDPSVEIDSTDNLHVSYCQGEHLMYATNVGGSWAISTAADVGEYGAEYTSLGLDSNDSAHISYFADSTYLGYAANSGGSWANYSIDSDFPQTTGWFTSLGIDSKDKVHISYQGYYDSGEPTSLKYATNVHGSWATPTVAVSLSRTWDYSSTSLAVDSSDKVHISSYILKGDGLKLCYFTNANGSWRCPFSMNTWTPLELRSTSIAVDSNDKVHICWNHINFGGLGYATNASGSWEFSYIESQPDPHLPGSHGFIATSLAIDSNNKVHVSYCDTLNRTLKYATNANGSWEISTIDDALIFASSLALDSADNVYVVYAGSDGIMYATNAEPVIPEFGATGVVVVVIATVCIFVALRRTSLPLTKS